jgi:anti-sigma factor RsiW
VGNIVTLTGAEHLETQSLLPWYVSRRLDASDTSRVEAHLAECPECRSDVVTERRLAAEWASLPIETEASWRRLRERVIGDDALRPGAATVSRLAGIVRRGLTRGRSWIAGAGWALAAVQAVALAAVSIAVWPTTPAAPYHTPAPPRRPRPAICSSSSIPIRASAGSPTP